ncbi:MAG: 16S rRNA (adenine(1518)-N(6)/adenine(1519)-N(6))-dimethyltransferase RsmA [Planctomycetota bacterium]
MHQYLDFKALREELSKQGFRFTRRWGQNFLTRKNLLDLLVTSAEVSEEDVVLEIGTGPCTLTCLLLQAGARVVGVEIDTRLFNIGKTMLDQHLSKEFTDRISWIQEDFLKNKNCIAPNVIKALTETLGQSGRQGYKVVSNLPYCIATPAIMNILESPVPWIAMAVTIQSEVADRFAASPGSRAYGQVSVLAQAITEVKVLKKIKPSSFWPEPDVDSSLLLFKPKEECLISKPVSYKMFKDFTRHIFSHRRKTWFKSLKISDPSFPVPIFLKRLEAEGIDTTQRAQELRWEEIKRISDLFYSICPKIR